MADKMPMNRRRLAGSLMGSIAALATLLAPMPSDAQSMGAWLRFKPTPVVMTAATIEPSATWNGTAGSGGLPIVDTTTMLGAQAIQGVATNPAGTAIRLTVPSTANITDNEWWYVENVGGTTEANGKWHLQVIDATHVDLCNNLTGNLGAYTCAGVQVQNAWTGGGSLEYPEDAIGNFDDPPYTWVQDTNHTITVAAGSGTRANIADVIFCLETSNLSSCKTVPQETINPRTGDQGWSITPTSRTTATSTNLNGDANLIAIIEPVNGRRWVIGEPSSSSSINTMVLHLNSNPSATKLTQNNYYVDNFSGAGSDSTSKAAAVNNPAAPFATIQGALNVMNNDSGAIINVKAQTFACTIATGSPSTVTCPTATLTPPMTFRFSNAPVGLAGASTSTTYYVDPDNIVQGSGSTTFEFSTLPPGVNATNPVVANNGTATSLAYLPSTPISTSGTGGSISVTGSSYTEYYDGPNATNPRTLTIQPVVPGTVTVRASATNTFKWGAELVNLSDITFDMTNFYRWQAQSNPSQLTISNSRLVDPAGPVPVYGRGVFTTMLANDAFEYTPTTALVESVSSNYEGPHPKFMRNVNAWFGFDAFQYSSEGAANDNLAYFNYHAIKPQNWLADYVSWPNSPLDLKISQVASSVTYASGFTSCGPGYDNGDCKTAIQISGQNYFCNSLNPILVFYSGALSGKGFQISSEIDATTGAAITGNSCSTPNSDPINLVVNGDATGAAVGDHYFVGDQGHADGFQVLTSTGSTTASDRLSQNWTIQRYVVERQTKVDPNFDAGNQGLQIQGAEVQGWFVPQTAAFTATGTTVQFSGAYTGQLNPDDSIWLGVRSTDGVPVSARVRSATPNSASGSTVTLWTPLPTLTSATMNDVTGVTGYPNGYNWPAASVNGNYTTDGTHLWDVGKGPSNVMFQNVVVDQGPTNQYYYNNSEINWLFQNVTFLGFALVGQYGYGLSFCTDERGFITDSFTMFDSIVPTATSWSPLNGLPAGVTMDNDVINNGQYFQPPLLGGTNILGRSAPSASPLIPVGSTFSPTSLVKAMRSKPLVPFDYYGATRTQANSIGAVN